MISSIENKNLKKIAAEEAMKGINQDFEDLQYMQQTPIFSPSEH